VSKQQQYHSLPLPVLWDTRVKRWYILRNYTKPRETSHKVGEIMGHCHLTPFSDFEQTVAKRILTIWSTSYNQFIQYNFLPFFAPNMRNDWNSPPPPTYLTSTTVIRILIQIESEMARYWTSGWWRLWCIFILMTSWPIVSQSWLISVLFRLSSSQFSGLAVESLAYDYNMGDFILKCYQYTSFFVTFSFTCPTVC